MSDLRIQRIVGTLGVELIIRKDGQTIIVYERELNRELDRLEDTNDLLREECKRFAKEGK